MRAATFRSHGLSASQKEALDSIGRALKDRSISFDTAADLSTLVRKGSLGDEVRAIVGRYRKSPESEMPGTGDERVRKAREVLVAELRALEQSRHPARRPSRTEHAIEQAVTLLAERLEP